MVYEYRKSQKTIESTLAQMAGIRQQFERTTEKIDQDAQRTDNQIALSIHEVRRKREIAGTQETASKIWWMAASVNLQIAFAEHTTAQEALLIAKKRLTGEALVTAAIIDKSGAEFAKSLANEGIATAKGIENIVAALKFESDVYAESQRRNEATGEYSIGTFDSESVELASKAKAELNASIEELSVAIDDMAAATTKRTATVVTLPPTAVGRTDAVLARADAMNQLTEARTALLSAKVVLKAALDKWNVADAI